MFHSFVTVKGLIPRVGGSSFVHSESLVLADTTAQGICWPEGVHETMDNRCSRKRWVVQDVRMVLQGHNWLDTRCHLFRMSRPELEILTLESLRLIGRHVSLKLSKVFVPGTQCSSYILSLGEGTTTSDQKHISLTVENGEHHNYGGD